MSIATLSGIYIYPVKSLGGIALDESEITSEGLQYDRRWMLVDDAGEFLTQRTNHAMTGLHTKIYSDELHIYKRNLPSDGIAIPLEGSGSSTPLTNRSQKVKIWSDEVLAAEEKPEFSKWLSDALGISCRLVKMDSFESRKVNPEYGEGHFTGFSDGYPVLIANESSLEALNRKLESPVEMLCFRPNLVISGLPEFLEDEIRDFEIGDVKMKCVKPCSRCVMVNISPEDGSSAKEPLKTLATFRTQNNKVYFAQNAVVLRTGKIRRNMEFTYSIA